jgi:hypothetical protein
MSNANRSLPSTGANRQPKIECDDYERKHATIKPTNANEANERIMNENEQTQRRGTERDRRFTGARDESLRLNAHFGDCRLAFDFAPVFRPMFLSCWATAICKRIEILTRSENPSVKKQTKSSRR